MFWEIFKKDKKNIFLIVLLSYLLVSILSIANIKVSFSQQVIFAIVLSIITVPFKGDHE